MSFGEDNRNADALGSWRGASGGREVEGVRGFACKVASDNGNSWDFVALRDV